MARNSLNKNLYLLTSERQGVLSILLLTFLAYIPILFAGFVWDDEIIFSQNAILQSLDGLWKIWIHPSFIPNEGHYWPLTYTSLWLDFQFWGTIPLGYHLMNLVLHGVNSILLFMILKHLRISVAWLASAIFALHPIHVESVAWVIERKDVLSGFFYLLSVWMYLQFDDSGKKNKYYLSFFFFICAMLSKSVAISLPLTLLLYLWWRKEKIVKKDFLLILPFMIISVMITLGDIYLSRQHNITSFSLSFIERSLIAGHALWFYIWKVIWPLNLIAIYPRWYIDVHSIVLYYYPISFAFFLIILWALRKKIGKGALVAVLFFSITVGPTLGFIDFSFMGYTYVADRFVYLASIGLIIIFSQLLVKVIELLGNSWNWVKPIGAILLLFILGFLTWQQARTYNNIETLFSHTLKINPNAYAAHTNLGIAIANQGKLEEAKQHFIAAIRIQPNDWETRNNLGVILGQQEKWDEAMGYFQEAVKLSPKFAEAYNNLGMCYFRLGKYDEAIDNFKKAVQNRNDYPSAQKNLQDAIAAKHNQ